MKRRFWMVSATLATLTLIAATPTVQAQGQGRGNGGGRGFFMGGPGGPMGGRNRMVDPTNSNLGVLIQRNDVRTELLFSARQKEQLEEADKQNQTEVGEKLRANRPDFAAMRNMSDEERTAKREEMRTQMQTLMTDLNTASDKKIEGILKPDQNKRLHELDLQWRGGLAVADTKIAEKVGLTAEQNTKVGEMLNEYRTKQREMFQTAMEEIRGSNPNAGATRRNRNRVGAGKNGANGSADATPQVPAVATTDTPPAVPAAPPDMTKITEKMDEIQASTDKMRMEYGEKALALLTEDQMTKWKVLLGKKFTFRKVD